MVDGALERRKAGALNAFGFSKKYLKSRKCEPFFYHNVQNVDAFYKKYIFIIISETTTKPEPGGTVQCALNIRSAGPILLADPVALTLVGAPSVFSRESLDNRKQFFRPCNTGRENL